MARALSCDVRYPIFQGVVRRGVPCRVLGKQLPVVQEMVRGNKVAAVLVGGGPAPGINAVIRSFAFGCLEAGIYHVVGVIDGFEYLSKVPPRDFAIGRHYCKLDGSRQETDEFRGVAHILRRGGSVIGTARTNPAGKRFGLEDFGQPSKCQGLERSLENLDALGVRWFLGIGGDDTLKSMMHLAVYAGRTQAYKDMQFVYAPKTIDNDAPGVDFTFGHFTAAERAAEYIYNVLEDARTTNSWFIIGCMGRNAGFLPMLAAFGGEASGVIIPEQVGRGRVDVDSLARSVIDLIDRRQKEGKHYGVVVVAEGLTDLLPEDQRPQKTDAHGHVDLNAAKFEEILAIRVNALAPSLKVKTGRTGYEGRSASPIVFDQFYASALGFGAFSLLAQGMTGVMPVIRDGYRLRADGFDRLVDGRALGCGRLVPRVRRVKRGSFFEEVALTSMAPTSRAAFEAVWRRESRGG